MFKPMPIVQGRQQDGGGWVLGLGRFQQGNSQMQATPDAERAHHGNLEGTATKQMALMWPGCQLGSVRA